MADLKAVGTYNGKEFYLDLSPTVESDKGEVVHNPTYKKIVWRIPDIREAVQSQSGFLILSADYSQIEVKLMAYLSGDPVLIAAINSGKDIHSYNAVEVFGSRMHFDYDVINAAKKDKGHPRHAELIKLRNDIKTTTFGVPYGAGPSKVAVMTGMTKEKAAEFIEEFFSKFHVLRDWIQKQGDDAIRYGFSRTPRGRRRFYDVPDENSKERDKILAQIRRYAGNQPIQSSNVDLLKPAMHRIYRDLRVNNYSEQDARLLFCVHDEVVMTAKSHLALRTDEEGNLLTLEQMEQYSKEKKKTLPGPIEKIMMTRMQETYDETIINIVNKIDVSIATAWEKA